MDNLPFNLKDRESLARKLFSATIGSAGVRLAGMALAFFVGVQLARYLGPEQYGVYGLAMATVIMLSTIATFGVPPLATREAAVALTRQDWPALRGLLTWSHVAVVSLSVLAAIVAAAVLVFRNSSNLTVLAVAAIIPLAALIMLFGALLRGLDWVVISQSFDSIIRPFLFSALLASIFALSGVLDAATALALNAVAAAITAVCAAVWLIRALPKAMRTEPRRVHMRGWVRSAIPMGLTDILRALGGQFPILVLGLMVSATDIGVFRVALSSVILVAFPYSLMATIAPPFAATLHANGDRRRLQLLASSSVLVVTAITAAIGVFLYVFGEPLIVFIFGADYEGSWQVLVILCLASLITAAFGISPAVLYATGREKSVTLAFTLSLIAGLTLSFGLVPVFGVTGAAWALVGAALVNGSVLYVACKRQVGLDPSIFGVPLVMLRNKDKFA